MAEPERFVVVAGHLCEVINRCTCGEAQAGAHLPECGLEMIAPVADLLKPPEPVQIQTVDAAVLLHRFDRLAPQVVHSFTTSTHQVVAREALKAMREALRLPPGSGGTGAHAARERAYTGQPRAQGDPRLRTGDQETPDKTQTGEQER